MNRRDALAELDSWTAEDHRAHSLERAAESLEASERRLQELVAVIRDLDQMRETLRRNHLPAISQMLLEPRKKAAESAARLVVKTAERRERVRLLKQEWQ